MMAQQLPKDLYQKWTDFGARVGAKSNLEQVSKFLAVRYAEPHRHYHTLPHIRHCLNEFDGARHIASYPDEVELALWFHDSIYDTRKKDNEEKSARNAYCASISMGLNESFARRVGDLIVFTKHDAVPTGIDARVLVDVDLAILGGPREKFKRYEQEIRQEYNWVSDEDFRAGRTAVLMQFLARDSVYSTEFFRKKYENVAQANLKYSLSRLRVTPKKRSKPLIVRNEPQILDRNVPEAGLGLFDHWLEHDQKDKGPDAGLGLFDHWLEHDTNDKEPDAGIGLFHYDS